MGDEYLVWRVVARERDEVLLRWEVAGFHGCTWFYIPHNENAMVFGSSFPLPLDTKERQHTSLPKKLFIDASRNLPADAPVGQRFRSGLVRGLVQGVTGVHVMYSKYLLLSAFQRVLEEEQTQRERGERPL